MTNDIRKLAEAAREFQGPTAWQLWPGERWGDSLPCIHGTGKRGPS